jgi:phosphatidate cytidylyltransferase
MTLVASQVVLLVLFSGLFLFSLGCALAGKRFAFSSYLHYTACFFGAFAAAELLSFTLGVWLLSLLCFWSLREYFSLADLRLQDRLAMAGAYLSIPFMICFIQIDWYGMFIVSIPVYAFLAVFLLVSLGGRQARGTLFSVGVLLFGLFLFVYCLGHIGYLMRFSVWMAAVLILGVALCDGIRWAAQRLTHRASTDLAVRLLLPIPLLACLLMLSSPWTGVPLAHNLVLSGLLPLLVILGQHTLGFVEADLGVELDAADPGEGKILDNLSSLFFAAPIVYHYIRYYLT